MHVFLKKTSIYCITDILYPIKTFQMHVFFCFICTTVIFCAVIKGRRLLSLYVSCMCPDDPTEKKCCKIQSNSVNNSNNKNRNNNNSCDNCNDNNTTNNNILIIIH